MDKIGELFQDYITDSNSLYALQVFIETFLTVCILYILYKTIIFIKKYKSNKKRERGVSDSGIELITFV